MHTESTNLSALREAGGLFLSAEQTFDLRHEEHDPARWLPKALDLARDSYYIPLDLCDGLVGRFAPGVPLPSASENTL